MSAEGYKGISIPETLVKQIEKLKREHPDLFTWRSTAEFCIDAIRRKVDRVNMGKDFPEEYFEIFETIAKKKK